MLRPQLFVSVVLCYLYHFSYHVTGQENPWGKDCRLAVCFCDSEINPASVLN